MVVHKTICWATTAVDVGFAEAGDGGLKLRAVAVYQKKRSIKMRRALSLILLMSGLLFGLCISIDILRTFFYEDPDTSCDPNDAVYQTLVKHAEEWFSYLSAHPQDYIRIEANGRGYRVEYYEPINDRNSPLIFVQTFAPWNSTPWDGWGYIYVPSNNPPSVASAFNNQDFEQLRPKFYCYYPALLPKQGYLP